MTDFLIRVVVDPRDAKQGTRVVRDELGRTETAAGNLNRTLRRAFTFAIFAAGARQVARLTDSFTNAQNRLRTVTETEEDLSRATEELFAISNRTRSSFEATAEVYARVGLAAKDLGVDQERLLRFTESLNQAVILSGASATEAQAGLIQLSQGLASGALRGDELRSVLEQLPVVADVIARSLGVTRGELRKLGEDGKLSAEVILGAFEEADQELDERFAETTSTIGQAFEVLGNGVVQFVGETDKALGASTAFAAVITTIGENVGVAASGVVILSVALATNYVPAMIAASAATGGFLSGLKGVVVATASNPFAILAAGAAAAVIEVDFFLDKLDDINEEIERIAIGSGTAELSEVGKIGDEIQRLQTILENAQRNIRPGDTADTNAAVAVAERLQGKLESLRQAQEFLASGTARTTVEAKEQARALEELEDSVQGVIDSLEDENRLLALNQREREVQSELIKEIDRLERKGQEVSPEQRARIEAAIRENQALEERADVLDRIFGPQERFQRDLEILQDALDDGTINQEQFNAELERLVELLDGIDLDQLNLDGLDLEGVDIEGLRERIAMLLEDFKKGKPEAEGLGRSIEDALGKDNAEALGEGIDGLGRDLSDFFQTGKFEADDFAGSLQSAFSDILANQLLQGLLGSAAGGAGFGLIGSFFSRAQHGAHAEAGQPFIVGEGGKEELFVPDQPGTIVPAGETAAIMMQSQQPAAAPLVVQPQVSIRNVIEGDDEGSMNDEFLNRVSRNRRRLKGMLG